MHCPLCQHSANFFHQDKNREYFRCANCLLVFVPSAFHLSSDDEKAVYDQHENNPNDLRYLRFLNRLAAPLLEHLNSKTKQPLSGLDFGCGPGPGLATLMNAAGHRMSIFDIFYAPQPEVLETAYDFVTCTEVVEHFNNPSRELNTLFGLLKEGATLGIMTKLVINQQKFAGWHYKNDPTHISFFSVETFEYLAERFDCKLIYQHQDVIMLQKNRS